MGSLEMVLEVAAKAAIVNGDGLVLVGREAPTDINNTKVGKYGLIGGRLQHGESFFDGLKREVLEETGLKIIPVKPLYVGEWHPLIKGQKHQIIAVFMLCRPTSLKLRISREHDDLIWIKPEDRQTYRMMEPDCFVIDELVRAN